MRCARCSCSRIRGYCEVGGAAGREDRGEIQINPLRDSEVHASMVGSSRIANKTKQKATVVLRAVLFCFVALSSLKEKRFQLMITGFTPKGGQSRLSSHQVMRTELTVVLRVRFPFFDGSLFKMEGLVKELMRRICTPYCLGNCAFVLEFLERTLLRYRISSAVQQ